MSTVLAGQGQRAWWGEAADEPALARQSVATTAREDARPTENCKRLSKREYLER